MTVLTPAPVSTMIFFDVFRSCSTSSNVLMSFSFLRFGGSDTMLIMIFHSIIGSRPSGITVPEGTRSCRIFRGLCPCLICSCTQAIGPEKKKRWTVPYSRHSLHYISISRTRTENVWLCRFRYWLLFCSKLTQSFLLLLSLTSLCVPFISVSKFWQNGRAVLSWAGIKIKNLAWTFEETTLGEAIKPSTSKYSLLSSNSSPGPPPQKKKKSRLWETSIYAVIDGYFFGQFKPCFLIN